MDFGKNRWTNLTSSCLTPRFLRSSKQFPIGPSYLARKLVTCLVENYREFSSVFVAKHRHCSFRSTLQLILSMDFSRKWPANLKFNTQAFLPVPPLASFFIFFPGKLQLCCRFHSFIQDLLQCITSYVIQHCFASAFCRTWLLGVGYGSELVPEMDEMLKHQYAIS